MSSFKFNQGIYYCILLLVGVNIQFSCHKQSVIVLKRIAENPAYVPAQQLKQAQMPFRIDPLPTTSPFPKDNKRNRCIPCLPVGKKYIVHIETTRDPISNIGLKLFYDNKQTKEYSSSSNKSGNALDLSALGGNFNAKHTKWVSPALEFKAINVYAQSFPTPNTPSYRNDMLIEIHDEQGELVYHSTANLMAHPPNWREGNVKEGLELTVVGSMCKNNNNSQNSICQNKGRYPENGKYKVEVQVDNGGTIQRLFIFKQTKNGDADYESFDVYQKQKFTTPEFELNDQTLEFSVNAYSHLGPITIKLIKDNQVIETIKGDNSVFIRLKDDKIEKNTIGAAVWSPAGFWTTYIY